MWVVSYWLEHGGEANRGLNAALTQRLERSKCSLPPRSAAQADLQRSAKNMKSSRYARYWITLIIVTLGVVAIYYHVFSTISLPVYPHGPEWDATVKALQSLPDERAKSAISAYVEKRRAMGLAVPGTVSLDELVKQGFLSPDEVVLFRDMTVALCTSDLSGCLSAAFAEVYLPNGHMYAKLADGSIVHSGTSR